MHRADRYKGGFILLLLGLLGAAHPAPRDHSAPLRPPPPPTSLVVLLVVDQLRPDYLERYGAQFSGGFRQLLRQGMLFQHGEQDHAITETAPGHSTLLSGREPASTGIVNNARGVLDPTLPLLDGSLPGASPRRFLGTTLYDWMVARDPDAQALSVSRKDRGAILPIGRARAEVYWYHGSGFTTSRYYADTLPAWLREFNARRASQHLAGAVWRLRLPRASYSEADSAPFENGGQDFVFPHRLPSNPDSASAALINYPWMDSLTLRLALEGVRALQLGTRSSPDLLSISLSTTDAVGHAFGPNSRELHDHLLWLDLWLGQFLDSLTTLVPRERILLVLTADHGVQSFPEAGQGGSSGRVRLGELVGGAGAALARRWRTDFSLEFDSGLLSADTLALHNRGIKIDRLAGRLAIAAGRQPGVLRVYTPRTLGRATSADREARLWRHLIPKGYGWLLCASLKPGYVWSEGRAIAEHGSTAPEDVRVPILFWGRGVAPARVARPVRTVDIAPTLARMLGVKPTEALDGAPLAEVVGRGSH
jgi:type I phosphodiesterase/nucleotide pyrophosphatase